MMQQLFQTFGITGEAIIARCHHKIICFILCTAQFDGVERMSKEESGSPTVKQQTMRHKSWTPKSLRPNPPSPTSPSSPSTTPDSETPIVDPTLPLEKQRCEFVS